MDTTTTTRVNIRTFKPADYFAITAIHNANFAPDYTREADDWQFEDERTPAYCRQARWVAEADGQIVGMAEYTQHAWAYDPRKFATEFAVDPAFFGRGIGTRLYNQLFEALAELDPVKVDTWTREDMTRLVGFLQRRGYVDDWRMWLSELDLTTFDPSGFADRIPVVESQGIRICSLADLDPSRSDVQHQLFDLWMEVRHDMPLPPGELRTDISFDDWWALTDRPTLMPECYFLALDGDRYVGTSQLWRSAEADSLRTGLTAVRRAYRHRGIASALEMRALMFGLANGYQRVFTENASINRAMLGINEQLGFVKHPAWVHYAKAFDN